MLARYSYPLILSRRRLPYPVDEPVTEFGGRLEFTLSIYRLTASQIAVIANGETNVICIDWGENEPGQETGILSGGDTVVSCAATVLSMPAVASAPAIGSVSPNGDILWINGRECGEGQATLASIVTTSDQIAGLYTIRFTATTEQGKILPRAVRINVVRL